LRSDDLIHEQETGTRWDSELEKQLCYEIKTFLLAGHETSAAMLCWSLFELTQSQECMDKVRCSRPGMDPQRNVVK